MQIDPLYSWPFISNIYSAEDQNFKTLVVNPSLICRACLLRVFNLTHGCKFNCIFCINIFVFFTTNIFYIIFTDHTAGNSEVVNNSLELCPVVCTSHQLPIITRRWSVYFKQHEPTKCTTSLLGIATTKIWETFVRTHIDTKYVGWTKLESTKLKASISLVFTKPIPATLSCMNYLVSVCTHESLSNLSCVTSTTQLIFSDEEDDVEECVSDCNCQYKC